MQIQLTPQQQEAIDRRDAGQFPRVVDSRTNACYVLIPESDYDALRELLDDDLRQSAIHSVALKNAAQRMDEMP